MNHTPNRHPAGVPVGGQFAPTVNPEADLDLAAPTSPTPLAEPAEPAGVVVPGLHAPATLRRRHTNGEYEVIDAVTRDLGAESGDGYSVVRRELRMDGFPEVRAEATMAGLALERTEGADVIDAKIASLPSGTKVTALLQYASGTTVAKEGTIYQQGSGTVIVHKASRSKGIYLTKPGTDVGHRVLAIEKGYGKQGALADALRERADAHLPRLREATTEGIPVNDGYEPPSTISAAFVVNHPGFDGSQDGRGVVFFATDREPTEPGDADEIVNGYMVVPGGSGMFSEHGSLYASQLKAWGGRVAGYRPGSHTFADAARFGDRASSYGGDDDIEAVWQALRDASR